MNCSTSSASPSVPSSRAPTPGRRSRPTATPSSTGSSLPRLPDGIPSHDTFRRVFCLLDPEAFQRSFSDWVAAHGRLRRRDADASSPSTARPHAAADAAGVGWRRCTWSAPGPAPTMSPWARWPPTPNPTRSPPSPAAGAARPLRGGGDDRRDGLPEGDRRQDRRPGRGLPAGRQGQPAASVRGHRRGFDEALETDFAGLEFTVAQTEETNRGRQETAGMPRDHRTRRGCATSGCGRGWRRSAWC